MLLILSPFVSYSVSFCLLFSLFILSPFVSFCRFDRLLASPSTPPLLLRFAPAAAAAAAAAVAADGCWVLWLRHFFVAAAALHFA